MAELYHDNVWNKQYEKLVEFKRKNGNYLVPRRYQEDASLGRWVSWQRVNHGKNTLRLDRKVLLDELGFAWKVRAAWKNQYEKLVEFKQKNGNCRVPQKYQEDVFFGKWVSYQRQMHAKNKLRLDRQELLEELGFAWEAPQGGNNTENNWHLQYEKLAEFKRKNGHCIVPARYHQEDVALGSWVNTQRQHHRNNKLRIDRKKLLDEIGFVWNVEDHQWHLLYEKLVEFKRKNGHCLVPRREDMSLGKWVSNQQQSHRKNKLRLDRKGLLDELGFVWVVDRCAPETWHQQYEKLVEFKRQNGNCLVPTRFHQEDVALGSWVNWQRQHHRNNKLRIDRKELRVRLERSCSRRRQQEPRQV
jgi:hypothetical protein